MEESSWPGNNFDFYFLSFILVQPVWDALSLLELEETEKKQTASWRANHAF